MINLLINGICGKMGAEVVKQIKYYPEIHLLGGLSTHCATNLPYPVYPSINEIKQKPDILLDFSAPQATMSLLPYCLNSHIPFVIATTGFSKEEQTKIKEASLQIPIFQSSNMSYCITFLQKIATLLSQALPNSEIEIVEVHHSQKKDSPSGTALMLADSINHANGNSYSYQFNRHQKSTVRNSKEIGFSSIRGGNIVGEHEILFFQKDETISIKHCAYSRSIFADGALKAVQFLVNQKPGFYTMENLL